MNEQGNTLIEASAGTGKTFSLATHFIRLMLERGVRPEEIIALTFTRAAAQEIFAKLAQRLADASMTEEGAEAENQNQKTEKSGGYSRNAYAKVLAEVIASQHIDTIATLDSFILRMVRYFPLELGFQGGVEILGAQEMADAQKRARMEVLHNKAEGRELVDVMVDAFASKNEKTVSDKLTTLVDKWHTFHVEHPGKEFRMEDVMSMLGFAVGQLREVKSVEDLRSYAVATEEEKETFRGFFVYFGQYTGYGTLVPTVGIEKKICEEFCKGSEMEQIKFGRKMVSISFKLRQAMKEDIRNAIGLYLVKKVRSTLGGIKLAGKVEKAYDKQTRKRGRLSFGDLPLALSNRAMAEDEIEAFRLNLEYRFDERFTHWAIDEFQDTSRAQWECLQNLIDEAAQGEERTATIVGDVKQAIYAWRGGDENILMELATKPTFRDPVVLAKSYRYGRKTVAFINSIFGVENISEKLAEKAPEAAKRWANEHSWKRHELAEGKKGEDYVCIRQADEVLDETIQLTEEIWDRRAMMNQTDKTLAILVRSNSFGREIASRLREVGVDAIFEGENSDAGHPIIACFLSLLHFGVHPGDTYDYEVIRRTPLKELFREEVVESRAQLSAEICKAISHMGLVRTLREYVGTFAKRLDAYSQAALNRFISSAQNYEANADAESGIDGFLEYFERQKVRDMANPSVVNILSIHRSKGLGFDWVIVPIKARESFLRFSDSLMGDGWVINEVSKEVAIAIPVLAEKYREAENRSALANLHNYYVAFTRNKEALWVVMPKVKKGSSSISIRNLIVSGLRLAEKEIESKRIVFESGTDPSTGKGQSKIIWQAKKEVKKFSFREGEENFVRKTPSHTHLLLPEEERIAATLFDEGETASLRRGTAIHAYLETIEWIDEESEKKERCEGWDTGVKIDLSEDTPMRRALMKPKDGEVKDLWRERSFEIAWKGEWVSGVFDRVVFIEREGRLCAEIYDFKTNRRRVGEDVGAFIRRMKESYSAQMEAYRGAICVMTGIPKERITATLLLTELRESVGI